MKSYGFTESNGDWSLAYPIASCLTRMTTDYVPTAASRSSRWPRGWRLPGSPIAALKAIPIIMVKIATMKPCRLSGPTAWPMPGRKALMSHAKFSHPRPWQKIPDRQQRHGGRARRKPPGNGGHQHAVSLHLVAGLHHPHCRCRAPAQVVNGNEQQQAGSH